MCRSCKEQTETLINEIDNLKEKVQKYEDRISTMEFSSSDMVRDSGDFCFVV